jgi:prephenate dehydrogenase
MKEKIIVVLGVGLILGWILSNVSHHGFEQEIKIEEEN